jgi:peptide chain release factor 1
VTESQGRIHTSTATVAVLPAIDDVEIRINPADLEVDVYISSGPGGQHMQKNATAVRITHKPTGMVVSCESERSQTQNRERAMAVLRARLYEEEQRRQMEERGEERRLQVGSGERSEKIRTYNYPQNRITDHRIGLTLYRLETVMDGDLDEIMDELATTDQADRLQAIGV